MTNLYDGSMQAFEVDTYENPDASSATDTQDAQTAELYHAPAASRAASIIHHAEADAGERDRGWFSGL